MIYIVYSRSSYDIYCITNFKLNKDMIIIFAQY